MLKEITKCIIHTQVILTQAGLCAVCKWVNSGKGQIASKSDQLMCGVWRIKIGWWGISKSDSSIKPCCMSCHYETHNESNYRVANGALYRVCCKTMKLCTRRMVINE